MGKAEELLAQLDAMEADRQPQRQPQQASQQAQAEPTPATGGNDTAALLAQLDQQQAGQGEEEPTLYEALSPRGSKTFGEVGGGRQFANEAADAFSLTGRAIASLPAIAPGGETYREALSRTRAAQPGDQEYRRENAFAPIGRFVENVVRDPATMASLPLVALAPGGSGVGARALQALGIGAAEGATSAGMRQLENYGETGRASVGDAAMEVLLNTGTAGLMEGGGQLFRGGKALTKDAMSKFSEIPVSALDEATDKARMGAARKAMRTTGGDLLPLADDLQADVISKRASFDKLAQEAEQLKAMKFSDAVTGGRLPSDISASDFGVSLRETAENARSTVGERFGRGQGDILNKYGVGKASIARGDGSNILQGEVDSFLKQIKYDPKKGYGVVGNRVVPDDAVKVIKSMRDQLGAAETVEDAINMRRLIDQKINFGRDGQRLFERGSDSDWAMTQLRNRFNDAIEDRLGDGLLGDTLVDAWRANNKRYSDAIGNLQSIDDAVRMGKTSSETYMGKIKKIGVDKLREVEQLAKEDSAVAPVWGELKRGYLDDFVRAGADADGIDYKKFANAWNKADDDMKQLMLGTEGVGRIEKALKEYAPSQPQRSDLGRSIVGMNPNAQRTVNTLENIGSRAKRDAMRELEFLDDVLGNTGDNRVSQIANDTYLAKQLKMTPDGKLPIIPDMRTGKFWAGMAGGSGTGAALGSAMGPAGSAAGSVAGGLAGLFLQSPSAAVTAARILNVTLPEGVTSGVGFGTRAGMRSSRFSERDDKPRVGSSAKSITPGM